LNNWFLVGDRKKGSISTGKMDQVIGGEGADVSLPIIPTKFIVIRDLEIESKELCEHFDAMKKDLSVGGSLGYGPFKLSGSYSNSKSTTKFEAESDGEILKVKDCQIIGWLSAVVPFCPKLDSPKIDESTSTNDVADKNEAAVDASATDKA